MCEDVVLEGKMFIHTLHLIMNFPVFYILDFLFGKLYAESLARFQGGSPYIYPLYGLGELPQVCFQPLILVSFGDST